MEKRYTCSEVAEIYRVKVNTVWEWIRKKKLSATKIGKQYFIFQEDLTVLEGAGRTVQTTENGTPRQNHRCDLGGDSRDTGRT